MFLSWKCIDLVAYNVYIMLSFVIINLTNGYMKNLSPVKPFNNDRKESYFHFHLQTENEKTRVVSFSPEKQVIRKNTKSEVQSTFWKIEKKYQFVTIAHINNESELYDIVNVTGTIYHLDPVETVHKNEKKNHLRKATLQDKTNDIPISVFGDLVNQINNEGMTVTLVDLRVSKYMTTRLLKSADTTMFQVSDKEMSINPKDLRDANSKSMTATIVGVDLTSLNKHLVCLKCEQIVVPLDDDEDVKVGKNIFICNACNSMVSCYRVWCSNNRNIQISKIHDKILRKHKI